MAQGAAGDAEQPGDGGDGAVRLAEQLAGVRDLLRGQPAWPPRPTAPPCWRRTTRALSASSMSSSSKIHAGAASSTTCTSCMTSTGAASAPHSSPKPPELSQNTHRPMPCTCGSWSRTQRRSASTAPAAPTTSRRRQCHHPAETHHGSSAHPASSAWPGQILEAPATSTPAADTPCNEAIPSCGQVATDEYALLPVHLDMHKSCMIYVTNTSGVFTLRLR